MHRVLSSFACVAIVSVAMSCGDSRPRRIIPSTPIRDAGDSEAAFGREVYLVHCAGCHGATGDGQGTVELDRPARAFALGGFAFGNTREALFKTVSDGMPNNSKMQAWRDELGEKERWAVVDHVRTLMPAEEPVPPQARKLVVRRRPQIVRGHLKAIVKDAPRTPRGALLGLPGGISFEYDLEDVRLLGVRTGEFADRVDWSGRGGQEMKPLGTLRGTIQGGNPTSTFAIGRDTGREPTRARLGATFVRGTEAGLAYRVREKAGGLDIDVEEVLVAVEGNDGATAFDRQFRVTPRTSNRSGKAMLILVGPSGAKSIPSTPPGSRVVESAPERWVVEVSLRNGATSVTRLTTTLRPVTNEETSR